MTLKKMLYIINYIRKAAMLSMKIYKKKKIAIREEKQNK
jgi:hypothetical protein